VLERLNMTLILFGLVLSVIFMTVSFLKGSLYPSKELGLG
jgi:hypothetical protein